MKLSVIIPARNEENCVKKTVDELNKRLEKEHLDFEILVINDHSNDKTENILKELQENNQNFRFLNNAFPEGFGWAVRYGLEYFKGDAIAVYMADASDSPDDLVRFFKKFQTGYDCVFGSRFIRGGTVRDYPLLKLILNRMANFFIKTVFMINYNDTTNAFKLYSRETINGLKPFLSHHFNITVELPLKAIIRGYNYTILPNSWTNRTTGISKLKIKEMGSRYLFIVLYCLIEKWLSVGDYLKKEKKLVTTDTSTKNEKPSVI